MEVGLTALPRLAWVGAIVPVLLASLPLRSLGFLPRMLMGFAARAKITRSSSSGSLHENKRTDEYIIPYVGWSDYVSCPHNLAGKVIYAGVLVSSGGSDITA